MPTDQCLGSDDDQGLFPVEELSQENQKESLPVCGPSGPSLAFEEEPELAALIEIFGDEGLLIAEESQELIAEDYGKASQVDESWAKLAEVLEEYAVHTLKRLLKRWNNLSLAERTRRIDLEGLSWPVPRTR